MESTDLEREKLLPRMVRDRRDLNRAVDELGAASEQFMRRVLAWTAVAAGLAIVLFAARRFR